MSIKQVISDTRNPIKIWTDDVEESALQQIRNLANMPFIFSHIAVMPDVHAGKGSTIGTVFTSQSALIPAAVGVDIGCGVSVKQLPYKGSDMKHLGELRSKLEAKIPVGFSEHKEDCDYLNASWRVNKLSVEKSYWLYHKAAHQMGTLGGGNHFLELDVDENDNLFLLIHSGSRGLGHIIAEQHIQIAQKRMEQYFIELPDKDLAFLVHKTPEFDNYLNDMEIAQGFAKDNRTHMRIAATKIIEDHCRKYNATRYMLGEYELTFDCHHNFIEVGPIWDFKQGITFYTTRKGAVKATSHGCAIIPGSMGTNSYIVTGNDSKDSFSSCAHGAGRRMSRNEAKKSISEEDFANQTKGVECRQNKSLIDEAPGAYKDINEVMSNQDDLVKVVAKLSPILCIKG